MCMGDDRGRWTCVKPTKHCNIEATFPLLKAVANCSLSSFSSPNFSCAAFIASIALCDLGFMPPALGELLLVAIPETDEATVV